MSYHKTDVLIVCFSVVDPTSYETLHGRFSPELNTHCPSVPILLVGTKCDLKADPTTITGLGSAGKGPVTYEQGASLATQMGAVKYLECSCLDLATLRTVFEEAIRIALPAHCPTKKAGPLHNSIFSARKFVLDDLLQDGVISQEVHQQYILKLTHTFGHLG
uniref:Uncharacterized protein n=1 Tax=Arcella intermedia TaxID=1963864 RepID=A0A6B2LMS8_9EUKA